MSGFPLLVAVFATQRLLGLSMEDLTPPLDTPDVVGGLKTRRMKTLNHPGASSGYRDCGLGLANTGHFARTGLAELA